MYSRPPQGNYRTPGEIMQSMANFLAPEVSAEVRLMLVKRFLFIYENIFGRKASKVRATSCAMLELSLSSSEKNPLAKDVIRRI